MCDMDKFKSVNDVHGHDVGDEVLQELSTRIRKNIRAIDLACRYGGEEFIIAMPDTDINLASIVAERLRKAVESHPFVVANGTKQLNLTISIGVSFLLPEADSPLDLVKRADMALYDAKHNGRNQVVMNHAA